MTKPPNKGRSAVTNGSRLFLRPVDGRTEEARRFGDLLREIEAEHGGPGRMNVVTRAAARAAETKSVAVTRSLDGIGKGAAATVQAIDRVREATGRLGTGAGTGATDTLTRDFERATRAAQDLERASSRATAPSLVPARNDNAPTARGLSTYQKRDLAYQGGDVVASLGSGAGLGTVAFQQGPQILQGLASSEGGLKGGLTALGQSAAALVTPFTVAATTVTGLGIAFGVAATQAKADRQVLEGATQGIGRATGNTASQLDAIARSNAEAGKVSTSTAREMVAAYNSTGEIATGVFGTLIQVTERYALLTGQDAATATAELTRAFADIGTGADTIASKIGGLDDKTRQLIATQIEQGDRSGAQATAAEYLKGTIDANASATTGWAAAWNTATAAANGYWEAAKRIAGIKLGIAPEGAQEAVTRLTAQVEATNRNRAIAGLEPMNGKDNSQVRELATAKVIADQERMIAEGRAAEERAAKASTTAGKIAKAVDPNYARLSQLRTQQSDLRDALADPLARSKLADQQQTEEAYLATSRAITTMTDATGKMVSAERMAKEADQLRIDSLNAKTDAEKKAVAERQKAFDLIGKTITPGDARGQIGQRGTTASSIISGLAQSFQRAALQALVLGQGPLAGIFGSSAAPGSGTVGGLVGGLFGGGAKAGADAGGGFLATIGSFFKGFSAGGYTGPGPVDQPAGLVHSAEVVLDTRSNRSGGWAMLEGMRRSLPAGRPSFSGAAA